MLKTAILAAREAGNLLLNNINKLKSEDINSKKTKDFVTEVDKNSEKLIINIIEDRFPEHDILAEETGKQNRKSDYCWIIDPLDGTTNYIHSYPMFTISIGLQYQNEVILGVVFDPSHDELFAAEKGRGVFLNGSPIVVSQRKELDDCLLVTGFPFRQVDIIDKYLEIFKDMFLASSGIRRDGSAALDLCYVACGRLDGFWEHGLSTWDIAAGSLILKEAGGMITDFKGKNDYLESGDIIAANPKIHSKLIEIIKKHRV